MRIHCATMRARDTESFDPTAPHEPAFGILTLLADACLQVGKGATSAILVLRGSARVRSSEGRFELVGREWLLLDPSAGPTIKCSANSMACVVAVDLRSVQSRCQRLLNPTPGRGRFGVAAIACLREVVCGVQLHRAGNATEERGGSIFQFAHLAELLTTDAELLARSPGRTSARKLQVFNRLQRALLFIQGNLNRNVRLDELAKLSRFSPWYFTKTFTQVYGVNPQAYARACRLERARRLIEGSNLTIAEVAADCGFDNPSAFSRAFSQRFGLSASTVRRSAGTAMSPAGPSQRNCRR